MDVSEAVDPWVALAPAEIARLGFAQIDLDNLLGDEPEAAAAVGLDCLQRIVALLPEGADLDAVLTIPLEPATEWDRMPPALDDALAADWIYGPGRQVPGLYLVPALHWRSPEQVEEYKRPLKSRKLPPQFVAYYRAWRKLDEVEFDRCVYIRSFPT